jgi:hypothetical protein
MYVLLLYTSQEFIHNHSVQLSVEMPVERGYKRPKVNPYSRVT